MLTMRTILNKNTNEYRIKIRSKTSHCWEQNKMSTKYTGGKKNEEEKKNASEMTVEELLCLGSNKNDKI